MKQKIFNRGSICGFGVLFLLLILVGCQKQLDINQSPNSPSASQGSPSLVFPVAVLATAGKVGGDLAIVGGMWSQYFTQSVGANQYTNIDSYDLAPNNGFVTASYDILFTTGLKNYQFVIDKAKASGNWNYFLMGTVMKAYTTEILVDLYDQIPFSEALQGGNNLSPKFDDGYSIYTSLLSSIDTALSKDLSINTTNPLPGTQDLIFGGNMSNWKAFANTLKLKMYLRMINTHSDVAAAGVKALYANGASFLTTDAAITNFTNSPSLDNPMYEQNIRSLNTTTNIRASKTFVTWLTANSDPRIVSFFGKLTPSSINQGDYGGNDVTYLSAAVFAQSAIDPVEFISLPESYFLQAEADIRFFGGAKAQALYNQGVLAAFTALKLDGSSYVATNGVYAFPASGTSDQKIEAVIVQKWASCAYGCHGIEAFFEKNRTGYPRTSTVYSTNANYIPGQLVIPIKSVLSAGLVPKRFVFPQDESSRNKNTPPLVPITTKVWWGL